MLGGDVPVEATRLRALGCWQPFASAAPILARLIWTGCPKPAVAAARQGFVVSVMPIILPAVFLDKTRSHFAYRTLINYASR